MGRTIRPRGPPCPQIVVTRPPGNFGPVARQDLPGAARRIGRFPRRAFVWRRPPSGTKLAEKGTPRHRNRKDPIVTLHRTISRIQLAPARRDSSLVATVALLADLVEKPRGHPIPEASPARREVAELAVAVAVDTESKLKELERRVATLERLAVTDPLTGLLNRRGLKRALQTALSAARRYGEQGILISIDLDGFKFVNDTYGHAVGDKVLKQVARILSEGVRETDSVGRVGGDEFIVLLTRVPEKDGVRRARLLESQLNSTAVNIDGRTIMVRASCGTQTYGSEDDAPTLLDRADSAMYRRKRTKGNQPGGIPADS